MQPSLLPCYYPPSCHLIPHWLPHLEKRCLELHDLRQYSLLPLPWPSCVYIQLLYSCPEIQLWLLHSVDRMLGSQDFANWNESLPVLCCYQMPYWNLLIGWHVRLQWITCHACDCYSHACTHKYMTNCVPL